MDELEGALTGTDIFININFLYFSTKLQDHL